MLAVYYFFAGALGAITRDIFEDNTLTLPKLETDKVLLGFLGGALIGGVVGVIADNNFVNALLAGYVGNSLIQKLSERLIEPLVED